MTGQEIPSQVVELAAPDQFIPPLPGWRERSPSAMAATRISATMPSSAGW